MFDYIKDKNILNRILLFQLVLKNGPKWINSVPLTTNQLHDYAAP